MKISFSAPPDAAFLNAQLSAANVIKATRCGNLRGVFHNYASLTQGFALKGVERGGRTQDEEVQNG